MQPSTRDTAKNFAAFIAATGFVFALILSAPANAMHGSDFFGHKHVSPPYYTQLAKTETAPTLPRQQAPLNSVMTDTPDVVESYGFQTPTPEYDAFIQHK